MKKTTIAAVLLAGTALMTMPAQAEFILADNVFVDLSATGFGNFPPLLTLQNSTFENGAVISQGGTQAFLTNISVGPAPTFDIIGIQCGNGPLPACTAGLAPQQSTLTNIATLGWTSGAEVGVGLNTNQTGSTTGLLFNELVLNIFDAAGNIVGTFGGNDAILITQQQLDDQQGQGNAVFNLALTPDQQAQFTTMLNNNPGNLFAGLAASFGCTPVAPASTCIGMSFDGAESFLGFPQSVAVPGPIVGAGIPGLIAACGGMVGLNFWRRRRNGNALPA